MKTLQKTWWPTLLKGIVLLILAFMVFRHPASALIGVATYIGISLLVTGILLTGVSIGYRDSIPNRGAILAGGLLDIVFGFVLLSNPVHTAITLPFVVGFWIIITGIMSFADAFQSKKEEVPLWGLGLFSGVISVLIGYIIMSNLLFGVLAITTWMGIGFAIAGIMNIAIGFKLKSL
jgi:uncharacterized membrane protein HdeD (DUF308 family)